MISWADFYLPPINLFSAPVRVANCQHTHWAVYYSFNKRVCIDCKLEQPLLSIAPEHQR